MFFAIRTRVCGRAIGVVVVVVAVVVLRRRRGIDWEVVERGEEEEEEGEGEAEGQKRRLNSNNKYTFSFIEYRASSNATLTDCTAPIYRAPMFPLAIFYSTVPPSPI